MIVKGGLPKKILSFTITGTLQMAFPWCFWLILINVCWPKVMHVDQRILQQRHTPQGNVTILPTEILDLPTEIGLGGCHTPTSPLSAGPAFSQIILRLKPSIPPWIANPHFFNFSWPSISMSSVHEVTAGHRSLSGTISCVTDMIRFLPITMTGRFSNINSISYAGDWQE